MNLNLSLKLIFCAILFFTPPFFVQGDSYDFYVDKNYDGEERDGSDKKPFKTIEKALEKASENKRDARKIYVKNGEYKESLVLEEGVKIYGQNKNKTIIKPSLQLQLNGNNFLKNLTVSGGTYGIMIVKGDAEIENCIVKNASDAGIKTGENLSFLEVKNSIILKNRKGFYVQKNSRIELSGNQVFDNLEEGIDIRERVIGSIKNNKIHGNGEGGIEVVVGSADILISRNEIRKNSASGVSIQFYNEANKIGKIKLSGNTVSHNGAYGIRCSTPSGGDPSSSYWRDSLDLIVNKIENNKGKAISGSCRIIQAVTNDEEKTNIVQESKNSAIESREEEERLLKEIEERRIIEEKEKELKEKITVFQKNINETNLFIVDRQQQISDSGKFKIFLVGYDTQKIREINLETEKNRQQLIQIKESVSLLTDYEEKLSFEEYVKNQEENIGKINLWVGEKERKFSLFGWLAKIFN